MKSITGTERFATHTNTSGTSALTVDEEEGSISLGGSNHHEHTDAEPNDHHHPFFDSFVSVGPNTSNLDDGHKHTYNSRDESICIDDVVSFAGSSQATGTFHTNSKRGQSTKSIQSSSKGYCTYGDENTICGNSKSNSNSQNKNQNYKHLTQNAPIKRFLKYLIAGLLVLSAILVLVSFVTGNVFYSMAILPLIGVLGLVFWNYETKVRNTEKLLIDKIHRSEAIVDNLFPEIVRDRIMEEGNLMTGSANPASKANVVPAFACSKERMGCTVEADNEGGDSQFIEHSNSKLVPLPPLRKTSPSPQPPRRIPSIASTASFSTFLTDKSSHGDCHSFMESGSNHNHRRYSLSKQHSSNSDGSNNSNSHCNFSGIQAGTNPGSIHSNLVVSSPQTAAAISPLSISSYGSKPIADYFPSATILFADIVGFTSWASIRDPAQVFELLETVYGRFDEIAKKKGVFKVETIGDCYVAATGLPNAMEDHAVVMASFARRCLESMLDFVSSPTTNLGPGTEDLGMRFGIHSGSVIGGVLRGAKSRYQLFGDTINTASRIESSSEKNKIHLSEQTADLIVAAGKRPWIIPREEKIVAKGKGELQTYWLTTEGPKNLSAKEKLALPAILKMMAKANIDPGFIKKKKAIDPIQKRKRLVDYHTNILAGLMKKLTSMRHNSNRKSNAALLESEEQIALDEDEQFGSIDPFLSGETMNEIIIFPTEHVSFASQGSRGKRNVDRLSDADSHIVDQLRELVSRVANFYREDRPFHSFQHTTHSVLSMTKLFAAIDTNTTKREDDVTRAQHEPFEVLAKTKSMLTHPMTQFVLVFVTLVYDADDDDDDADGEQDTEEEKLAPGQKSIQRVWNLWMDPAFRDLRLCLCKSQQDLDFFRRLLAKSMSAMRKRTSSAVTDNDAETELPSNTNMSCSHYDEEASKKTMVIIVQLLEASRISHSLQHFYVFKKWNKLLFKELYIGYKRTADAGEENKDPSLDWYEKELELFEGRILLAKKLKESGVLNKTIDVYLNAVVANKREWKQKGQSILQDYISDRG